VEASGEELGGFFATVMLHLRGVQHRVVAGSMARALGHGGKSAVAAVWGLSRNTVIKAQAEVEAGIEPSARLDGDRPVTTDAIVSVTTV